MNTIKNRLEDFKKILNQKNIDFYIVPTADFHNSEYVSDYFKVREFQFKLYNDIYNANQLPLSLTNISIKYKITGQVR